MRNKTRNEVTGTALAAHLCCSRVTINSYVAKGVIARLESGLFDQDECRNKVMTFLRDGAASRTGNSGDNLAAARADLARAQREAIEWKNGKAKGDYVSAAAVLRL